MKKRSKFRIPTDTVQMIFAILLAIYFVWTIILMVVYLKF